MILSASLKSVPRIVGVAVTSLALFACGAPKPDTNTGNNTNSSSSSSSSSSTSSSSSSSSSSSTGGGNNSQGVAAISVQGNRVLFDGQPGSIAGPSLFWSNAGWGGEKYYNKDVVRWVKQDWNAKLIRTAMGVDPTSESAFGGASPSGAYLDDTAGNQAKQKAMVIEVIEAAIENDMYVIVDWHSHHAEDFTSQAISFFSEIASQYGGYNNIIYEVYNEPLQVSWSGVIKPYAEKVIQAIRANDPDNLIIVGTPAWSQDVDVASNDPITNYQNIAYTLHFYAGTHKQLLRSKAQTALNNGIALFVTEWGSVSADGDGAVNHGETDQWINFLKSNNISHANWALNDKAEGASALNPGANPTGNWSNNDLTESGQKIKSIIQNW